MTELSNKELSAIMANYGPKTPEHRAARAVLDMQHPLVLMYGIVDLSGSAYLDGGEGVATDAAALQETVGALNRQFHTREFRIVPLCIAQRGQK